MSEALIFMLLELAPPGTNKSGACKLLQSTLRQVTFVLKAMHNNHLECQKNGVRVCEQSIPEEDKTATISAGTRQQAMHRNHVRVEDEYLTFQRMLNHGGGDGIDFFLSSFNGEAETTYGLCNDSFRAVLPRKSIFCLCQPEVFAEKVASEQTGNGNGFHSRLSVGVGVRNMLKTDELFELADGELTLVDLVLAVAALSVVEQGSYLKRFDEEVLQKTAMFSDDSDTDELGAAEEASLFYETHRFITNVPRAAEGADQLAVHRATQQKKARMSDKYTKLGKPVPKRYANLNEKFHPVYTPPLKEGEAVLGALHVEAGRSSVLVVNIEAGSPASVAFGAFRDKRTQVNSNDPLQKDAKSVTSALRLGGVFEVISIASDLTQAVGGGCGVKGGVQLPRGNCSLVVVVSLVLMMVLVLFLLLLLLRHHHGQCRHLLLLVMTTMVPAAALAVEEEAGGPSYGTREPSSRASFQRTPKFQCRDKALSAPSASPCALKASRRSWPPIRDLVIRRLQR
jgi:hypothetical protein